VMNDPNNASHYLGMFSKLIRGVLDASRAEYVSLEEELEILRIYIELESMRFGKRFDYEIRIAPDLDTVRSVLPPMLIQPYVENAIWHGLMHKEDRGKLLLTAGREKEELVVGIEDDGVGRKRAAELKSKTANQHKSHGMTVTHERLGIINDLYRLNARVKIYDLSDEKGQAMGTRVVLRLKMEVSA
jgi:LytS/YehU family sensor histidine kinase